MNNKDPYITECRLGTVTHILTVKAYKLRNSIEFNGNLFAVISNVQLQLN